jgi:hypothetical protein
MVELAHKLRTPRNAEKRQERAPCLTEQFPPPLSKESPQTGEELPPPNRRRLVALLSKLLERSIATLLANSNGLRYEEFADLCKPLQRIITIRNEMRSAVQVRSSALSIQVK